MEKNSLSPNKDNNIVKQYKQQRQLAQLTLYSTYDTSLSSPSPSSNTSQKMIPFAINKSFLEHVLQTQ